MEPARNHQDLGDCRSSSAGKLFWGMRCMGGKGFWVVQLKLALVCRSYIESVLKLILHGFINMGKLLCAPWG